MLDLDSLFSAPATANNGREKSPLHGPSRNVTMGAEGGGNGDKWPRDEHPTKSHQSPAGQGFSSDCLAIEPGNSETTETGNGLTLPEVVDSPEGLCHKDLEGLRPLRPVRPLFLEGDWKEIANRAPGGGAASSQFALHPSAVILLIAYCRRLDLPLHEQAAALVDLGQLPPGEQVRHWQEACIQQRIEPWTVLSIGAPMEGQDCSLCAHLLTRQFPGDSGRRQFHWACGKGYLILETGRGTERIWIAPPECQSFERWYPSDRR